MVLPDWRSSDEFDATNGDILEFCIPSVIPKAYYLVIDINNKYITALEYNPAWSEGNKVIKTCITFPVDSNAYKFLDSDEKQAIRAKIIYELKKQTLALLDHCLELRGILKLLGVDKLV